MEDNKLNFIIPEQAKEVEKIQPPKAKPARVFSNINFDDQSENASFDIKVIGIGTAGGNVVNHIAKTGSPVCDWATLYAFNTDLVSLRSITHVKNLFLLNKEELKGYGSGSNPEIGKQAVIHDADVIKQELVGTDILFIVAGMGKGAGSGGAPELANIAKELGILTISIVNMPSVTSEGNIIYNNAFSNLQSLVTNSNSITTVNNDKIISAKENVSFYEAYEQANQQITNIIEDITRMIFKPGVMNINFANLKAFFEGNQYFMGDRVSIDMLNLTPTKIKDVLQDKIKHSLSDVNIKGCKQIIANISLSKNAPTTIVADINKAFVEVTHNEHLAIATGVDYNDEDKIKISYLIAGGNYSSGFEEALNDASGSNRDYVEPTIKLEAIDDPDAKEYDNLMKDVVAAATPTEDVISKNIENEEK